MDVGCVSVFISSCISVSLLGSIPERDGSDLYNTSLVFGPDGTVLAKHRKMHLFNIDVPGKLRFYESDSCVYVYTAYSMQCTMLNYLSWSLSKNLYIPL